MKIFIYSISNLQRDQYQYVAGNRHDKDILAKIPSEKREYYENFMFRLVLHGTSHDAKEIAAIATNIKTNFFIFFAFLNL